MRRSALRDRHYACAVRRALVPLRVPRRVPRDAGDWNSGGLVFVAKAGFARARDRAGAGRFSDAAFARRAFHGERDVAARGRGSTRVGRARRSADCARRRMRARPDVVSRQRGVPFAHASEGRESGAYVCRRFARRHRRRAPRRAAHERASHTASHRGGGPASAGGGALRDEAAALERGGGHGHRGNLHDRERTPAPTRREIVRGAGQHSLREMDAHGAHYDSPRHLLRQKSYVGFRLGNGVELRGETAEAALDRARCLGGNADHPIGNDARGSYSSLLRRDEHRLSTEDSGTRLCRGGGRWARYPDRPQSGRHARRCRRAKPAYRGSRLRSFS
jgi:hypothetical protein